MTLPRVAYVSLWLPKPSETFVFREVKTCRAMGLPIKTYTLYAPLKRGLSPEMAAFPPDESLGMANTHKVVGALVRHLLSAPRQTLPWLKNGPFNQWRSLEGLGENLWAFGAGLHLARRFEADAIEHIHTPWASGSATAAQVASRLTGIPFSFAARAGDIYPPEGALPGKIADAAFVRVNHAANLDYMRSFAPEHADKVHLVYNALSLLPDHLERTERKPPLKLLAVGRFVPTKGFDDLLTACSLLQEQGLDFTLTLAGDGGLAGKLKRQAARLGLNDRVRFPGFLKHNEISRCMLESDVFVMPSVVARSGGRDGIPNVIMEAFAHGLPVVATDVAGIKEVVITGETGHLVEQHSPQRLAETIGALAADPREANRLAKNGKERVLAMFDQETNCRKLIELFTAHAKGKV
jgi:glycosyltransferase involved in cell wall biosynthesis